MRPEPYLVLPLMPGGDVGTLLEAAEDHKLPLEQAIDLAMQVCRGLEFAHSKGIVHRDLKPGNVWLTADGTARIGDFGLAVAIDRSRLTQEGIMIGTVSYMPPEQAMGGDVTPQSDLYSLGAMLYEMVTLDPAFCGSECRRNRDWRHPEPCGGHGTGVRNPRRLGSQRSHEHHPGGPARGSRWHRGYSAPAELRLR